MNNDWIIEKFEIKNNGNWLTLVLDCHSWGSWGLFWFDLISWRFWSFSWILSGSCRIICWDHFRFFRILSEALRSFPVLEYYWVFSRLLFVFPTGLWFGYFRNDLRSYWFDQFSSVIHNDLKITRWLQFIEEGVRNPIATMATNDSIQPIWMKPNWTKYFQ